MSVRKLTGRDAAQVIRLMLVGTFLAIGSSLMMADDAAAQAEPTRQPRISAPPTSRPTGRQTAAPTSPPPATAAPTATAEPTATATPTPTPGPRADLVITNFSVNAFTVADPVALAVTIRNQGVADSPPFHVHFYANRATAPSVGGAPMTEVEFPALRVGESNSVSTQVAGSYFALGANTTWALADARGAVPEPDEANNAASAAITMASALPTPLPTTPTPIVEPTPQAAPSLPDGALAVPLPILVPTPATAAPPPPASAPQPPASARSSGMTSLQVVADQALAAAPADQSGITAGQSAATMARLAATSAHRWSAPVQVSSAVDGVDTTPGFEAWGSWFPDVVADDLGNVHVVWNARYPQDAYDVGALFYARRDASGWTAPSDIAVTWVGTALRSALAMDPWGRLHLLHKGLGSLAPGTFSPGRPNSEDMWYTGANSAAADYHSSWSPAKRLSRSSVAYYPDLAFDSNGVLHAIWTESQQATWGIYYSQSTDGGATWARAVPLDESDAVYCCRAQLRIDTQDRLHVVWEVTDPVRVGIIYGIYHAISTDGGHTWSTSTFGVAPTMDATAQTRLSGPAQPAVGVDGSGTILLVFRDQANNQVQYRRSSDGSNWSAPADLAGIRAGAARPFDVYDMITDSAGHVHLVVAAYPQGSNDMGLFHMEWDGQRFGSLSLIANAPPFPEFPRLAVSEGNRLHLVWFNGSIESIDRTPIGIWYSSVRTGAPRVLRSPEAAVPPPSAVRGDGETGAPLGGGTPADAPATSLQAHEAWGAGWAEAPFSPEPAIDPRVLAVAPIIALMLGIAAYRLGLADLIFDGLRPGTTPPWRANRVHRSLRTWAVRGEAAVRSLDPRDRRPIQGSSIGRDHD